MLIHLCYDVFQIKFLVNKYIFWIESSKRLLTISLGHLSLLCDTLFITMAQRDRQQASMTDLAERLHKMNK